MKFVSPVWSRSIARAQEIWRKCNHADKPNVATGVFFKSQEPKKGLVCKVVFTLQFVQLADRR